MNNATLEYTPVRRSHSIVEHRRDRLGIALESVKVLASGVLLLSGLLAAAALGGLFVGVLLTLQLVG